MNRMDEDPGDDIAYRIWIGTIVTVVPATVITALRFTARTVSRVGLGGMIILLRLLLCVFFSISRENRFTE